MKRVPWPRRLGIRRAAVQQSRTDADRDIFLNAWRDAARALCSPRTVAAADLLAASAEPYPAAAGPVLLVVRLDPDRCRQYALRAHMHVVGFRQHLRRLTAAGFLALIATDLGPAATLILPVDNGVGGVAQPRPDAAQRSCRTRRGARSGFGVPAEVDP